MDCLRQLSLVKGNHRYVFRYQAGSEAERPAHEQPTPPSAVIRTGALGKLEKPPKPGGGQAKGTTEGTESTEG